MIWLIVTVINITTIKSIITRPIFIIIIRVFVVMIDIFTMKFKASILFYLSD